MVRYLNFDEKNQCKMGWKAYLIPLPGNKAFTA